MKRIKDKNKKELRILKAKETALNNNNQEMVTITDTEFVVKNKIKKTPKVSVIIPVFNVEQYLQECLESVITQTLAEIEIICIDDGSTDGSLDILKEYATKDNRITLISRENKGVGYSRDQGIVCAKGEFLAFMDPDDYYPTKDVLKALYDNAIENNVNICGGSLIVYDEGRKIEIQRKDFYSCFADNKMWDYMDFQYDYGFQRFIYRRDMICNNGIYFPNYRRFQDPPFMVKAFIKAKKFYAVTDYTYGYRWAHKEVNWTEEKVYHMLQGVRDDIDLSIKANMDNLFTRSLEHIQKDYKKILADIKSERIENIMAEIMKTCLKYAHDMYKDCDVKAKVSVVLPIYNAEPYLRECLDSIVKQTLREIEIICVNDGATDNSLKIIKDYAKRDNRVKYINKPNAGYGQTMNCGIDLATGEYIGIVEPDDFVDTEMYETLYKKAKELDLEIVKSGLYHYWTSENKIVKCPWLADSSLENRVLNPAKDKCVFRLTMNNVTGIYKRSLINKYNINFNETAGASYQDNGFWCRAHFFATRIGLVNKYFYYYRQDNENSSVNSKDKAFCIFQEYKLNEAIFNEHPELRKDFIGEFNYKKFNSYYFHYNRIDTKYKKEFLKMFSSEFKLAEKNDEIDYSIMAPSQKEILKSILKNYLLFYSLSTGKRVFSIKAYVAFLFYYIRLFFLRKKNKRANFENATSYLHRMRMDIKNLGNENNAVEILADDVKILTPFWFSNNLGQGVVVLSDNLHQVTKIKIIQDGNLSLSFKGILHTENDKHIPVWVDYKSIKIDGKEIISKPVSVWHDKPFKYEMPVKDGQEITLEIEQQYHEYTKNEIRNILPMLNSNSEYVTKNIDKIIKELTKQYPVIDDEIKKRRELEKYTANVISELTKGRIDIKNFGNANNNTSVTAMFSTISEPKWFSNEQGIGKMLLCSGLTDIIKIKTINDGKLAISFKGILHSKEGQHIPVWIDYKSIKVDGKEILSQPVATWHDKPFKYEMSVKDGQEITIEFKQQYHQYSDAELKDMLLKLYSDDEFLKENLDTIVENILIKMTASEDKELVA